MYEYLGQDKYKHKQAYREAILLSRFDIPHSSPTSQPYKQGQSIFKKVLLLFLC